MMDPRLLGMQFDNSDNTNTHNLFPSCDDGSLTADLSKCTVPFLLSFFYRGSITDPNSTLGSIIVHNTCFIPRQAFNSFARVDIAPASNVFLGITTTSWGSVGRVTVGNVVFSAGSNFGAISLSSDILISPGSMIEIRSLSDESLLDPEMSDITISIVALSTIGTIQGIPNV